MKERRHGLSDLDSATLLDLLRDCANSPPNLDLRDEPTSTKLCLDSSLQVYGTTMILSNSGCLAHGSALIR